MKFSDAQLLHSETCFGFWALTCAVLPLLRLSQTAKPLDEGLQKRQFRKVNAAIRIHAARHIGRHKVSRIPHQRQHDPDRPLVGKREPARKRRMALYGTVRTRLAKVVS
jgi:hypothetical protein